MSLARSAFLQAEVTMADAHDAVKAKVCEQAAVPVPLERVVGGRLRLRGWDFDIRDCGLEVSVRMSQAFQPVD